MSIFQLKYFSLRQEATAMKVGTDAMVLGALVDTKNASRILDVGSGTGILALMCAQKNPNASLTAIEIDAQAAEECAANFTHSPWPDRLALVHADFLSWNPALTFDLIVSNPPYYQTGKFNEDERLRLARHVGELTSERFFEKVHALMTPEGRCEIIIPAQDENLWSEAAQSKGLFPVRRIVIIGKREGEAKRLVIAYRRTSAELVEAYLTLRELDGKYTPEYIELTREFHGVPL